MKLLQDFWTWVIAKFAKQAPEFIGPPKPRRKYTRRKKTITSLLGNIGNEFSDLTKAHQVYKNCRGEFPSHLLKIGATVSDSEQALFDMGGTVTSDKRPTWCFYSFASGEHGELRYMALEKIHTKNPFVQPLKGGTLYKVIFCWKVDKHVWSSCYVHIKDSGKVEMVNEKLSLPVRLPNGSVYSKRFWGVHEIFTEDNEQMIRGCVSSCLNYGSHIENSWVISVRKSGKRLNFVIPREDAKHYFSDRETEVVSGKKKTKIMHFVEGHHRKTKSGETWIRPHIRGERQFVWNGYHCNIKAPEFGGKTYRDLLAAGKEAPKGESAGLDGWDVGKIVLAKQDEIQQNAFSEYSK